MLSVQNVSMSFKERNVLNNITFTVKENTINIIMGKSGSGKSTLLGIMSGLLKPTSGQVLFMGNDIYRWGDFRRSRFRNKTIGFVFQFFNLLPDLTAYQNILYPTIINPFSQNRRKDVDYLIEYLGLERIIHNYPRTLSGGELQRVAIARAIINRPKIVMADEPTGNLDDDTADQIISLFNDIRKTQGIAFVVVTHETRFLNIADTYYRIENSTLIKQPFPSETSTHAPSTTFLDNQRKQPRRLIAIKSPQQSKKPKKRVIAD
ncbi:MAG: ABC transporter ATP-binding protein [Spirochaetes bacterium]|nr:ABC transporter ATP-binding protein [Spirochaetota bacterium]